MSLKAVHGFRSLVCLAFMAGLCWPGSAQSQSPTTPMTGVSSGGTMTGGTADTATSGRRRGSSLFDRNSGATGVSSGQRGAGLSESQPSASSLGGEGREGESRVGKRGRDRDEAKSGEEKAGDAAGATPPGPRDGEAAAKAAADTGSGKEGEAAASGGGGPQTIGGGGTGTGTGTGGAGGGTNFTKGTPGTVSVAGGDGAFEPVLDRDVEYGEVPDEGEPLTLEGPMPLGEFLAAINMSTNWNIITAPEIQDVNLKFWITDTKPKTALQILKFYKIYYEWDTESECLRVMSEEDHLKREYGKRKPHEFKVKEVEIALAEAMITSLLSSTGRSVTDQRTGIIYVWDTEDNIREMERIMADVDVPLAHAEFNVRHADVPDIEAALTNLLTPSGNLLSDVRTGQIFVWDTPASLQQMRMAVEKLDLPVESRTFELTHVNVEDVTDVLEGLLSERGTIQVDPRYNTLIASDLPSRLEKIQSTLDLLDRELETRTWVIKYADIEFIADEIEAYIPGDMGSIVVNDLVHQVTVTGLPARLDEIDKLIKMWDIKRAQVLIEAFIVEVSDEVERAFSVNWSYFGNAGTSPISVFGGKGVTKPLTEGSGAGELMQVGQLPYAVPAYGELQLDSAGNIVRPALTDIRGNQIIDRFAGNRLAVTLDYLDKQNKATILASPRVTVQDGEEATFENATRVPYVSASTYYGGGYGGYNNNTNNNNNGTTNPYYGYGYGGGLNNTNRVEFVDVGTILTVFPLISEDNTILLDISAEDSTYTDKDVTVNDQKSTIPEKTARRADTQVRVKSGETIVLGGLRRDRSSRSTTKTPFLGDLPLVGGLFRNPQRKSLNNSLLIFITTTVVDENTSPEASELAAAEAEMNREARYNKKDFWGRLRHRVAGSSEEGVAIGREGTLYAGTRRMTLEELQAHLEGVSADKTVVVRRHPAAPPAVVDAVMDAARGAGLAVELAQGPTPVVPTIRADAPVKKTEAEKDAPQLVPATPVEAAAAE